MKYFLITVLALIVVCLLYGFFIEPRRLAIRTVKVDRFEIPQSWKGLKAVFCSDLHVGWGMSLEQVRKIVQAINATKPDLFLFGGDLISESTKLNDPAYAAELVAILKQIDAPKGKFAIPGNHDSESVANRNFALQIWADSGITFLENQIIDLDGLRLVGLAEAYHQKPDLNLVNQDCPALVLMHQPDYLPQKGCLSANQLILSGHSHNGQVTFFGKPLITVPLGRKYVYGLKEVVQGEKRSWIYTSAGLGTVHIHARFFNLPEIVILEF